MKLSDWRQDKGWTQQRLAEELEVDISFVKRIETGRRRPGPALVERIFLISEGAVEPNDFHPIDNWRERIARAVDAARAALFEIAA